MTTWRRQVERKAGPALVVVSRLPRWVPFAVVAALLIGGLAVKGVLGAVLLLVLAALLSVLLLLSWPALRQGPRAVRVAVLAVLVIRAVTFALN